ncbi:hypothetical protein JOQ06_000478 [Pogonophryne albipinna]|uniref:Uncharacterized protein n=1 Tax=Pogonophryne albipinna TaxID=1090488 RepID=A0AAD6F8B2_9TELE|nr:hypothetical protein JOQ06_000478 [Pogonophryne albipinna]
MRDQTLSGPQITAGTGSRDQSSCPPVMADPPTSGPDLSPGGRLNVFPVTSHHAAQCFTVELQETLRM